MHNASQNEIAAYHLIFEGLQDDDPTTVRRVKATFITDLDLSSTAVAEIFENAPAVAYQSSDHDSLVQVSKMIEQAGGIVKIVENIIDHESEGEFEEAFEFDLDLTEENEAQAEELLEVDSDPEIESEIDNLIDQLTSSAIVIEPTAASINNASLEQLAKQQSKQKNADSPLQEDDELESVENSEPPMISLSEDSLSAIPDLDEPPHIPDELLPEQKDTTRSREVAQDTPSSSEATEVSNTQHVDKPTSTSVHREESYNLNTPVQEAVDEADGDLEEDATDYSSLAKTTGITVLICLILAPLTWYLKQSTTPVKQTSTVVVLDTSKKIKAEEHASEKKETSTSKSSQQSTQPVVVPDSSLPIESGISYLISGTSLFGEHQTVKARFTVTDKKIDESTIDIETKDRPEQSKLDIVHGIPRPPWIFKVKISDLDIFKQDTGEYVAEGTAFLYINYEGSNTRVAAPVVIRGIYELDKKKISGTIVIVRGSARPEEGKNFIANATAPNKFDVYLKSAFETTTMKEIE